MKPFRILAAVTVVALQGCGDDEVVGPRPDIDVAFTTVVQGGYWSWSESDSSTANVLLLADAESWNAFWQGSSKDIRGSTPPLVDFEREVVVAVLDKVQPQTTEIEVESVRRESDRVVVRATRRPGLEWLLLPPPFRPYHFVRINRRVAPVDLYVTDHP